MLIDPVVCIPVTYFIGENGLPLEVIGGSLPVDEFLSKANKALEVIVTFPIYQSILFFF